MGHCQVPMGMPPRQRRKQAKLTGTQYPEMLPFRGKERADPQVILASMPTACRSKAAGANARPKGCHTKGQAHAPRPRLSFQSHLLHQGPCTRAPGVFQGRQETVGGEGAPGEGTAIKAPTWGRPRESIRETQQGTWRGHCQRRSMCSPSGSSSRGTAPRPTGAARAGQSAHGLPRSLATALCAWGLAPAVPCQAGKRWKMAETKRLASGPGT